MLTVETTSYTRDSLSVIKHNLITEANLSSEDVEVIHIIYDTLIRSPAEPQRIMSKTIYKRSRKNNQRKEGKLDSVAVLKQIVTDSVHMTDSVSTEQLKVREETTLPNQLSRLAAIVSLLIVLLTVCIWYTRKNIPRNN